MKVELDQNNYLDIQVRGKEEKVVTLSIKAMKDQKTSILVTATLNEAELTSLISALVATKAKLG